MNFLQDQTESEDEKVMIIRKTSKLPFSSSSSSSSASSKYMWQLKTQEAAFNFDNNQKHQEQKLEFMDLSMEINNNDDQQPAAVLLPVEKEHMFDKVVTPSDVGKLNRLVIPKQHAEKYFPLDSSSNEKGLLLNFEDRNGKSWRFRYSYWNSSQSYVMTKGWSRFVKEKKLDAGDIVSFQRGLGELAKDRLYIDWRRKPDAIITTTDPISLAQMQLQNQFQFQQSVRWGSRLYSLPPPPPPPPRNNYDHHHNFPINVYPYYHHQQQLQLQQQYQLRSTQHQIGSVRDGNIRNLAAPLVVDSVPVVHGTKTAGKRLRLFGVNMECDTTTQDESSVSHHHHHLPNHLQSTTKQAEYSKKGKSSSLSFDLDL